MYVMAYKPEKGIREYNKFLFLREVEKAASFLGIPTPKVKFWTNSASHFNDGQIAHIHIDQNLICIPEPRLESMTEEEIIETANHEVNHLRYPNHEVEFQNTLQDLKIASWRPPAGTTGAFPQGYVPPKKIRNTKPIKYKCNFCGKRDKTKKCPHCGGYFCVQHIKPEAPYVGRVPKDKKESKNTHICSFAYSRYLDSLKEERFAIEDSIEPLENDFQYKNEIKVKKTDYVKEEKEKIASLEKEYIRNLKEGNKKEEIKSDCNICGKEINNQKCPYCKLYFCKEHFKAKEIYVGIPPKDRKEDKRGHLCLPFSRYLDKVTVGKYSSEGKHFYEDEEEEDSSLNGVYNLDGERKKSHKGFWITILIIILLFLIWRFLIK